MARPARPGTPGPPGCPAWIAAEGELALVFHPEQVVPVRGRPLDQVGAHLERQVAVELAEPGPVRILERVGDGVPGPDLVRRREPAGLQRRPGGHGRRHQVRGQRRAALAVAVVPDRLQLLGGGEVEFQLPDDDAVARREGVEDLPVVGPAPQAAGDHQRPFRLGGLHQLLQSRGRLGGLGGRRLLLGGFRGRRLLLGRPGHWSQRHGGHQGEQRMPASPAYQGGLLLRAPPCGCGLRLEIIAEEHNAAGKCVKESSSRNAADRTGGTGPCRSQARRPRPPGPPRRPGPVRGCRVPRCWGRPGSPPRPSPQGTW